MEEILKLRKLIDKGIPIIILARECHCTPASIQNYLSGRSIPSGTKIMAIRDGLNHYIQELEAIIRE